MLGVTGTQRGLTPIQLESCHSLLTKFREQGTVWMHNGDCIGADYQLAVLWRELGGLIRGHPPMKTYKRAWLEFDAERPPEEYLKRNKSIVLDSGFMLATPGEYSEQLRSGTWSTIRFARKKNRPLWIVYPDGSISKPTTLF